MVVASRASLHPVRLGLGRLPLFAGIAALALGCGGLTATTADAGNDAAMDDAQAADDGGAAVDTGPAVLGGIDFLVENSGNGGHFGADFGTSPWTDPLTCGIVRGCRVVSCPVTASTPPGVSAGTLTISVAGRTYPEYPDPKSISYSDNLSLITLGSMIGVAASGDVVPAFAMQTITVPPALRLTAPAENDAGPVTIDTSRDLEVAWSGGQPGLQLIFNLAPGGTCVWDAAAGRGTVPSAVLRPAGGTNCILQIGQRNQQTFTAGSFLIEESAWTGMRVDAICQ